MCNYHPEPEPARTTTKRHKVVGGVMVVIGAVMVLAYWLLPCGCQ